MSLENLYGEKIFSEFILHIYVVYRAGGNQFFFGACRIGHLVRVAIPAPHIMVECKKTPLCKVGCKSAQCERFSCRGKLGGFVSDI